MKLKSFFSNHKKAIIACVIVLFIGIFIGKVSSPSDKDISAIKSRNIALASEISQKDSLLTTKKAEVSSLQEKSKNLESKKEDIEKEIKDNEEATAKKEAELKAKEEANATSKKSTSSKPKKASSENKQNNHEVGTMVWITRTGHKYHRTNHCGNTNPNTATEVTLKEAESMGLSPCSKCF